MPKSRPLRVLALVLVAGCSEPDIEPKAGTWAYDDVVLKNNSCKGTPPSDLEGDFTLTLLGEGRFTIEAKDLTNPLDCSHSGGDFTCPETLLAKIPVGGAEAEVLITVEVEGSLDSSTRFTGSEVIRTTCTGADCAEVAVAQDLTLPCEYTYEFTGSAR